MTTTEPVDCESLLANMIAIDTVNSNISGRPNPERELSLYLDTLAQSWRLSTARLAVSGEGFNLLVFHQADPGAPWLLLESHLDTVATDAMTIDPWGGKIEAGRIYGRGACDTKGSGAAMLWALRQYAASGATPNNVAIAFTLDEEISKTGIRSLVREHLPQFDWRPTGAIVGEPTELEPVIAHNGVVRWKIHTHGVAAHSADPSQGRSAIRMMVRVIEAIETQYIARLSATHPLTGKAQSSINRISGGVQVNIIAEHCEIEIDRRVVPGEDADAVLPAVEAILDQLRAADSTLQVEQSEPFIDPPLDPAGGEAFCERVTGVLEEMGMSTAPRGVAYGTDASDLGKAGIPTVILGPGNIAQAHTKDEWLELAQLHRAVEVYQALMQTPLA